MFLSVSVCPCAPLPTAAWNNNITTIIKCTNTTNSTLCPPKPAVCTTHPLFSLSGLTKRLSEPTFCPQCQSIEQQPELTDRPAAGLVGWLVGWLVD